MNIGNVLFSPNGRIGQQSYWIGVLILIGANILLTWIPLLGFLVWLGLWYVGFCVYGKRLHDIGKSMWIHALVVLVSFVISIIAGVMVGGSIFAMAMSGNGEPDPAAIMSMTSAGSSRVARGRRSTAASGAHRRTASAMPQAAAARSARSRSRASSLAAWSSSHCSDT